MVAARPVAALLAEIEDHCHELDATAAEADGLGRAPEDLASLMLRLRVAMVKAPFEIGGDRLHLADQLRFFEALTYWNATAGWIGFNQAGATGMAGASLCEEGVELLFGAESYPTMAAVSAPSGTFVSVDGGLRATGTWRYASGSHQADWALLAALAVEEEQPNLRLLVADMADATLDDDWNVMALKGSGSVSIKLEDAFIPDALVIDPTVGPRRGGTMYSLGYQAYVAAENLGFTLGVCQRFMDELASYSLEKGRGLDGILGNRGAFQYEFGKGQLALNGARSYGLQCFSEADSALSADQELPGSEQEVLVATMAYCTETAVDTVSHLFHFAGAGAIFDSNILQRCFRDAHGSAQHHVASNIAYDRYGKALLAPDKPPKV